MTTILQFLLKQLEILEPKCLRDREEKEEKDILDAITDLNLKYAAMEINESPKTALLKKRTTGQAHSFPTIILQNMNPSSVSTITSLEKEDPSSFAEIISKNVKDYSVKIKILVLGSDGVGKTTLVNQILGINEEQPKETKALRIKKATKEINKKRVAVEFLDTNEKVQSSKVLESYLKIVDGVIFIINPSDLDTIKFVMEMAGKAIKFKDEFFVVGNLFSNLKQEEDISAFKTNLLAANEALQELSSRLVTTVNFVNLIENPKEKFLDPFLMRLLEKKKGNNKCL